MLPYEDRNTIPAAIIVAAGLAVGLAAGSWLVGQGLARFKSETRTVTVKGLVEREVKSDQAVWTLGLRRASDTLGDAHQRIAADREAVLAFLKKQGFADAEIERQPTRTVDKLARDFGQGQGERFRYVVTTSIEVTTNTSGSTRKPSSATGSRVRDSGAIPRSTEKRCSTPESTLAAAIATGLPTPAG